MKDTVNVKHHEQIAKQLRKDKLKRFSLIAAVIIGCVAFAIFIIIGAV